MDPRAAFAATSSGSTNSSSSTLMDDVLDRLNNKHEDAGALLRRMNSLLGLEDDDTAMRKRGISQPSFQSIPVPISASSSLSSTSSTKLRCGWFACRSVDDAE